MIGRNLKRSWIAAAFKIMTDDLGRYGAIVKLRDVRNFMGEHVDNFSNFKIGFKELEDDRVVDALEDELGKFCSDDRLKKLTKDQAVAEALKISLAQGLQPIPEIKLTRKPASGDSNPMNIDEDLKKTWSHAARGLAFNDFGEMATPASGAFTNYLGRLFKRDELQHITNETFINNLDLIYSEIQKDIEADKASTGRIARYILQAVQDLVKRKAQGNQVSGVAPRERRLVK